jgi:hypothetical protein
MKHQSDFEEEHIKVIPLIVGSAIHGRRDEVSGKIMFVNDGVSESMKAKSLKFDEQELKFDEETEARADLMRKDENTRIEE